MIAIILHGNGLVFQNIGLGGPVMKYEIYYINTAYIMVLVFTIFMLNKNQSLCENVEVFLNRIDRSGNRNSHCTSDSKHI